LRQLSPVGMARGQGNWEQDAIAVAVHAMASPIAKLEKQWDSGKLESRMVHYFRSGAKGLDFANTCWEDLVYTFADNVFGSIFTALSDRIWLNSADFLPVFFASIRELFPQVLLASVPSDDFEQTVLCAHDQAFEEQRFAMILHETVSTQIDNNKMKNRIYKALDAGRQEAAQMDLGASVVNPAEEFAWRWISASVNRIKAEGGGWAEGLLQPPNAVWLFQTLIEAGAFPVSLIAASGPLPPKWPVVAKAVHAAYGSDKGAGEAYGKCSADKPIRFSIYSSAGNARYCKNGSAKSAVKGLGHKLCAQAEDCMGTPASSLLQHMESGQIGDLYCDSCWTALVSNDPTLQSHKLS